MIEEPGIPNAILGKIHRLAPVLEDFFPPGSIKMGAETIRATLMKPSLGQTHRPRETLRSRQAFRANAKLASAIPATQDGEAVVGALLGAHCAGMGARASTVDVLRALCLEPDPQGEADATIKWLLASIRVSEAMRLAAACGVPIAALAEHLRARKIERPDLITWLNQFAAPE